MSLKCIKSNVVKGGIAGYQHYSRNIFKRFFVWLRIKKPHEKHGHDLYIGHSDKSLVTLKRTLPQNIRLV